MLDEDFYTGYAEIRYYDSHGTLVSSQEFPAFHGVTFVTPQKVLLYSSDDWNLYGLDDPATSIASGRFQGGPFEIIAIPQANRFLMITYDEEPCRKGFRIQDVDTVTGQVLAERFFETMHSEYISFVRLPPAPKARLRH